MGDVLVWIAETLVVPIAVAGLAAYFAARFAFSKDRKRVAEIEMERRKYAVHWLKFTMHQQFQDMENLKDFISSMNPRRQAKTVLNGWRINDQDVGFLAYDDKNELNKIILAEHEYLQACDALDYYNECAKYRANIGKGGVVGYDKVADKPIFVNKQIELLYDIATEDRDEAYNQLLLAICISIRSNKETATPLIEDLISK